MNSQEKWSFEPPLYFMHLAGGVRLLAGSNGQCAFMTAHMSKFITFEISPFSSVATLIEEIAAKLSVSERDVFGFQRFNSLEDLDKRISETFNYVLPSIVKIRNPIDHVSNWLSISSNIDNGNLSAISRRIATQIERTVHRSCALSDCYMATLHEQTKLPEEGTISLIKDYDAQKIGLEFTSLLDNLYYLRDALNNFVFRILTDENESFRTKSLLKLIKGLDTELSNLLLKGMSQKEGCINKFSTLRGVAQHSMGEVNPTFGDCYSLRKTEVFNAYYYKLILPLYDDWEALKQIEKDASKGVFHPITKEECKRFFSEAENHVDAFDFGRECFSFLMLISETIIDEFSLDVTPKKLEEKDIISLEVHDGKGNSTLYERVPETGKLEQKPNLL